MATEEMKEKLWGMPADTQGFRHRMDIKTYLADTNDTEEMKQRVFSAIHFVGTLVNTLQICRKNQVSWEEAESEATKWESLLPWKEESVEVGDGTSFLSLSDFEEDFIKGLPTLQLLERDKGLVALGDRCMKKYVEEKELGSSSIKLMTLYNGYVVYAVNQLAEYWDKTSMPYLAPLYPTAEVEESSLGAWSSQVYFNYCHHCHLAQPFDLYRTEDTAFVEKYFNEKGELVGDEPLVESAPVAPKEEGQDDKSNWASALEKVLKGMKTEDEPES